MYITLYIRHLLTACTVMRVGQPTRAGLEQVKEYGPVIASCVVFYQFTIAALSIDLATQDSEFFDSGTD